MRRGFARPADQLIGLAGHGRDDHRDLVAGVDLAFDMARHILMRAMSATEVPPNFITMRAMEAKCL